MKAIMIKEPGSPDVLVPTDWPCPKPEAEEVLIKVHAAGVNRPDVAQRQGIYPPPPGASPLPGLEVAGEVIALGEKANKYNIGDKVVALLNGGGYAEFATAHQGSVLPLPAGYDYIHGAAIPETFFTVWSNVIDQGKLKAGETLLVHGGTSGIGTTAILIAKAIGAKVIVTAGSEEKCQKCIKLGADHAICYKKEDFALKTLEYTQEKGADVILDMIGGEYTNKNYKAAATEGRIVQIAFLHGNLVQINLNYLMRKRLIHTGSMLRSRNTEFKEKIALAIHKNLWPLLEKKQILPVIDSVFPLEEAAKAHQKMEESTHIGKIILKLIP